MKRKILRPSASHPLILTTALFAAQAQAGTVWWDGSATGNWDDLTQWTTDASATTPDPATVPGAADDAVFNRTGVNGAESISLNTTGRSINSLSFANTGTTAITGAATTPTAGLTVGAGGITAAAGAGAVTLNISGTSSGTFSPLFLSASQTWNNLSANTFTITSNFLTGAGVNLTVANGTFAMTNTSNNTIVQGSLNLQNSAKLQILGDFTINGGLNGGATNTIENSGAASKWMFVNNPTGTTSNYGGTIQGNPGNSAVRFGFIKRGLGTQNITGSVTGERVAVEAGTVNVGTGGSLNIDFPAGGANNMAVIGTTASQNGVLNVNGGSLTSNRTGGTAINSATVANAQGFVRMTSGNITSTGNEIRIGSSGAGSYGAYTQDGGTMTSASWIGVGANGDRAVVNLNGGTINATTANFVTIGIGGTAAVADFNVNGGTLNATAANNGGIIVGERGTGTLNVLAGTVNAAQRGLVIGDPGANTGWNGVVNLRGGTINTNRVGKANPTGAAGAGSSIFNFHGGTLVATDNSTTFFEGLDKAYVYAGGGTINNGGKNITIGQSLVAPTGNGVSATGLTVTGSGFLDKPLVNITGDGVGAKAIANVDANGNLTGITITNPGVGYTTANVALLTTANGAVTGGVGATSSITGAPTLVANTTGNLTFNGVGITRLTGANTFGTANITAGNVQVDGSLANAASVSAGATLSGSGTVSGVITSTGGIVSPGTTGGADVGTLTAGSSVTLDATSVLAITINDEAVGAMDRIVNTGTFRANGASLTLTFTDPSYVAATTAANLASATRYTFITGPTDSTTFGNTTLIPSGDLATLGLSAGSREISAGGVRFYVEPGSFSLVPIVPVPEPGTVSLFAAALTLLRRRRKNGSA